MEKHIQIPQGLFLYDLLQKEADVIECPIPFQLLNPIKNTFDSYKEL